MKTTKSKWVQVGEFGVDSGQVLITDPCYLRSWVDNDFKEQTESRSYSYEGACNATLSEEMAGKIGTMEDGVAISTGYGDGVYPVYVLYKDGRVKEVKIKFF